MKNHFFFRILFVGALMALTALYIFNRNSGQTISPLKPFSSLPKQFGQWTGTEQFFAKEVYQVLGVDDSALIYYTSQSGESVELYVGYYGSQREGDIIHSPRNCMPGAGWSITETSIERLQINAQPQRYIDVVKLIISKNSEKQVVLYWFQSRGRYISSEYDQKFYLIWDAITKNRTDGSFVRLITPIRNNDEDKATSLVKRFAVELIPILDEYIPGADP